MPTTSQPDPATGPTATSSTSASTGAGSATGAYPGSATTPDGSAATSTIGPNTRLSSVLPTGTTAQQACAGFTDTEQCATALHASQNLSIPFGDLKTKVQAGETVTQAIGELKPGTDAATEAQRALDQARSDAATPQG
ncbi:MAG: hypothetical protein JOZ67_01420 [Gammaproteobacteria bacterium]|nr:hypothetical protein [Gammaproteobacteria bacterium]MBV9697316.1 hypothetical protein [Gammaproteobacteria bacterium]